MRPSVALIVPALLALGWALPPTSARAAGFPCKPPERLTLDRAQPTLARVLRSAHLAPIYGEAPVAQLGVEAGVDVVVLGRCEASTFVTMTPPAPNMRFTTGWMPTADLEDEPPAPPVPNGASDWAGVWKTGPYQSLTIRAGARGAYRIEGSSVTGAGDPGRVARGAVHASDVNGTFEPAGGAAITKPGAGECALKLWRLGPYLVVGENNDCFTNGAGFDGAYRRVSQ